LLLAPAGSSQEQTAAFLAAFCSWVSSTPAVSEKYSVVYLLPTVEGDPLANAQALLNDVAHKVSDESLETTSHLEMTLFDRVQSRGDLYRCGGKQAIVFDPSVVTVLQVAHGSLQPYGVGLRYFASTNGLPTRRGFFPLRNIDLADDARRFAALALADDSAVISVEATLRSMPEARCRDGRAGLCIYQPSTVRIVYEPQDSAFAKHDEITPLAIERWTLERDIDVEVGDELSARLRHLIAPHNALLVFEPKSGSVELKLVNEGRNFAVDFHARQAGTYRLTAFF
jgi:hypothetical protein